MKCDLLSTWFTILYYIEMLSPTRTDMTHFDITEQD